MLKSVKKMFGITAEDSGFLLHADSISIILYLEKQEFDRCAEGKGNPKQKLQHTILRMLVEQSQAEQLPNGFRITAENAVALDSQSINILDLPSRFGGSYHARFDGVTTHSNFKARIEIELPEGHYPYERKGPILKLSSTENYLLTPEELLALKAYDHHSDLPAEDRGEAANLQLITRLQAAKKMGMDIALSQFDKLDVNEPERIGVTINRLQDGSLQLTPNLGVGMAPEELNARWGQLKMGGEGGVMRVKDRILLLDQERLESIREVLNNRYVPRDRVKEFFESPSAFLDAAKVDLDQGFSVRVEGLGKLEHISVGQIADQERDWFGTSQRILPPEDIPRLAKTAEDLEQIEQACTQAWQQGAEIIDYEGQRVDVSDQGQVRQALKKSQLELTKSVQAEDGVEQVEEKRTENFTLKLKEASEHRKELLDRAKNAISEVTIDSSELKRAPFPHQEEGINWLLALITQALKGDKDDLYRLQGGLLADDMGLGKTFMTLVAMYGYYALQRANERVEKPILVVAPLSLLENWEDEVDKTFYHSPFRDIVILQSGRDLAAYRLEGAKRESAQLSELAERDIKDVEAKLRYALNIGSEHGTARLDRDKRLVITTYQTLRDYQFSLCRIDWGMVVFDEAQHIKNPNVLQTRAAKGLKADFKLLATGTPVENSLADFWCLMDTAQPGLLSDWPTFRDTWVKPLASIGQENHELKRQHGLSLRNAVDRFMLRRVKEDQLKSLPPKTIYTGIPTADKTPYNYSSALGTVMQGQQLNAYDQVLDAYHKQRLEDDARGAALSTLSALRKISLYPDLDMVEIRVPANAKQARQSMKVAGKLASLLNELDRIRELSEAEGRKVIIFMIRKTLQQQLKLWLDAVYGLDIAIINGDTKSVAKATQKGGETRKALIDNFEGQPGFNVIIMSPIAAGTGLTVVEANHVFHLERHWNPAKEAQATDRVYRIGQQRPVHIYLPATLHPLNDSFDVHMDRLMRGKLQLKDAVVVPEAISEGEIFNAMGFSQ